MVTTTQNGVKQTRIKEEWLLHKGVKCLYKACVFHNDNCGPYKLLKLKVDDGKIFSEQQLIENRSDLTLGEDTKICAHHHYNFGTGYRPKKTCQHPHHIHQPKQVKAAPTRVAPFSVIDCITKNYGVQFPIVSIQIPFVIQIIKRNQFPKCLSRNQHQL